MAKEVRNYKSVDMNPLQSTTKYDEYHNAQAKDGWELIGIVSLPNGSIRATYGRWVDPYFYSEPGNW